VWVLLVASPADAATFVVSARAGASYAPGVATQSGFYNPRASDDLVAVQSAAADTSGSGQDWYNPPRWVVTGQASSRAATYGSDTSIDGGLNPGLLGYSVEPMADTLVNASATVTGGLSTGSAGGRAYAVAEVKHRVVARAYPENLRGVLDPLAIIPVRLNYKISVETSTTSGGRFHYDNYGYFEIQVAGIRFSDQVCDYNDHPGDGGTIEDTRSFEMRRSSTDQTNTYTIKTVAETTVDVEVSSDQGGSITGQAIVDPFLYVDPTWEYAQYFMVQQESLQHPGQWVEVTRGWQIPVPTLGQGTRWYFELADGVPNTLVWQTGPGRSYDLWYSADVSVPFTHVDGFPQAGTGVGMKHPFTAGERGFFKITSDDGFALIPAGEFPMGDQTAPGYEGASDERPQHAVEVGAFYLAKHEVTKALWDEVAFWAEANGYDISAAGASGKRMNHPAHYVTWDECVKWCNARSQKESLTPCYTVAGSVYKAGPGTNVVCNFGANGYRLPTEAEWEKAARGGVSGKRYPWGTDTISHVQANYYASGTNFGNLSGDAGYHPTWGTDPTPYSSPVGSFAANGYGLYDMAGNLWEWCWDWYDASYYTSSPATDPRGPTSGSERVIRGGGWYGISAGDCRAAFRDSAIPTGSYNDVGFRPVRSSVP
jgi:formylglycine-generating enzyme